MALLGDLIGPDYDRQCEAHNAGGGLRPPGWRPIPDAHNVTGRPASACYGTNAGVGEGPNLEERRPHSPPFPPPQRKGQTPSRYRGVHPSLERMGPFKTISLLHHLVLVL